MSLSPTGRRLLLFGALLAAVVAASLSLRDRGGADVESESARPPGWWSVDAAGAEGGGGEELARQLSLPYAAGVVPATGAVGVVALDPQRVQPGVNLYVSGHRAEAILMSMEGTVLHRWRLPFERAFPGRTATIDSQFFRRAALLPDGDLVAIYQGGGVVRLDPDSRPIWTVPAAPYNDLWVAPDGERILYLHKQAVDRPDLRPGGPLLEDFVVALDGGGHELWRASLLAAFERSSFATLLTPLGPTADAFHANTLAVLAGPGTDPAGPFAPGTLLVSMRETNTIAVLDAAASTVLWAQRGPFVAQHEPSLLPSGEVMLFDNHGAGPGRSRVIALDPRSKALRTLWPPQGLPFFTDQAGSAARLGNGNLLVVESERGAAFEITPGGEVVWEFRSPHRAGERRELVAALFDVVRYRSAPPFAASGATPTEPSGNPAGGAVSAKLSKASTGA